MSAYSRSTRDEPHEHHQARYDNHCTDDSGDYSLQQRDRDGIALVLWWMPYFLKLFAR